MKNILISGFMILFAGAFSSVQAQSVEPVSGTDYIEIPNGKPLDPADGKIVVEEFFNYICPACYSFEPQFSAWTDQLPSEVKLAYVPAAFRADFVPYARAFYAAQSFGIVAETHRAVYNAIHRTHVLPAEGDKPDEEKIAAFYADYGVDAKKFLAAMRSFDVDFKMRRGMDYMRRSKVSGTPSIVINGRYLVRGRSLADMLRIASYLIDKELEGL